LSPIEWSQAVALTKKAAPHVGEILEAAFSQAQAVVAMLTGDDLARLRPDFCTVSDAAHETQLTPQARPNVLFEAGMALGKQTARTRDTPTNRWMHDRFDWHGLAYHGAF
jgi:Predicted nucleotide-binding protein containing TIR-like domain